MKKFYDDYNAILDGKGGPLVEGERVMFNGYHKELEGRTAVMVYPVHPSTGDKYSALQASFDGENQQDLLDCRRAAVYNFDELAQEYMRMLRTIESLIAQGVIDEQTFDETYEQVKSAQFGKGNSKKI